MELISLEHDFNGAPFPLFAYGEVNTSRFEAHVGLNIEAFGCDFHGTDFRWFTDSQSWMQACNALHDKLLRNPEYFDSLERNVQKSCNALWQYAQKLEKTDWANKTPQEQYAAYAEFLDRLRDTMEFGIQLVLVDFNPPLLSLYLQKIAKMRFGDKANESFALLTTNTQDATLQKQEESDFLRMLGLPAEKQEKAVKEHAEKFGFLSFGYRGPLVWDEKYFAQMLEQAKKQDLKPEEKRVKQKQEKRITEEKIRELEKNLTEKEKRFFAMGRKLTYLKPWRKEMQIRSYPPAEKLLRQIARQIGLPLDSCRYLTQQEMKQALMEGKIDEQLLQKRKKRCLIMSQKGVTTIYSGKEADRIAATIKEEDAPKTDTLQGTPATVGKATGAARIVNTIEDMAKMQKGDILLSVATNPVLIPAIRKAAAIVTDQGGLTCHAAIVSREFGIPCIVGTRHATRVFKDGDLLEVDAHQGTVRKV